MVFPEQMKKNDSKTETHPLLPSGEWEGFYVYGHSPGGRKGQMNFTLNFHEQKVEGSGSDEVGGFTWEGVYDLEAMTCKMVKYYTTHEVFYNGHIDENGIWGTWTISDYWNGGFHIWPKAGEAAEKEAEKKPEVKKLSGTQRKSSKFKVLQGV